MKNNFLNLEIGHVLAKILLSLSEDEILEVEKLLAFRFKLKVKKYFTGDSNEKI